VSYGPYVDTLVRKADPKGREITKIFKEDIADIHGTNTKYFLNLNTEEIVILYS
jgi:hypothetical protein